MRRDIDEVLTGIRVSNFAEPPPGAPDEDLRYAGTDVHERILGVLRKYHDNPPVAEMRKCLQGAGQGGAEGGMQLDENAARDILFFPREEHMRHYVTVLDKISRRQAGAEIAKKSEQDRLQHLEALFLNLLVLWHSRQWVLARAFMLHGGVQALMALQAPAVDAQIRWNGVEVLARLLIEHPDGWEFDWMDPIDSTVHPDHALHRSLYVFAQDLPSAMLQVDILRERNPLLHLPGTIATELTCGFFLNQALLIAPPPSSSCVDGGYLCLRIVAFWLSWLRQLYCSTKPQGFRVSSTYLNALECIGRTASHPQERRAPHYDDIALYILVALTISHHTHIKIITLTIYHHTNNIPITFTMKSSH